MNTIRWRVAAADAPVAVRPCGRCGANAEFASTGLFRVNAQKKLVDVWLVYRCAACGSVWNNAVISRASMKAVGVDELERYHRNDAELALACALDPDLLKRNGAKRGPVAYEVEGPACGDEDCRVDIDCAFDAGGIRLADVLRRKLGVSRRELERLVEAGRVSAPSGLDVDVLKVKLATCRSVTVRGVGA